MEIIAKAPPCSGFTNTTGGVFTIATGFPGASSPNLINMPGSNRLDGIPFRLRLSGLTTLPAGTYTATVQPLIYASTTTGFTPVASNAIFSAAAVNVTQASASVKNIPYSVEVYLESDALTGSCNGNGFASIGNQGTGLVPLVNLPSGVVHRLEPPMQFGAGITLANLTAPALSLIQEFVLEK